jgi:hypothetical protein
MGFRTGAIQFESLEAGAGIILTPSCETFDDLRSYAERRVQVLYAGVTAECLSDNKVDAYRAIELLKSTAKNDGAKIRELLRIICAINNWGSIDEKTYEIRFQGIEDDLSMRALNLVQAEAVTITNLTRWVVEKIKNSTLFQLWLQAGSFEIPGSEIEKFEGIASRFRF